MKQLISFLMIFLFALVTITCDKKITRAILPVSPCDFSEAQSIIRTNANSANLNKRKVLLEDYTGQYCGNCPNAARKAELLEGTYGAQLIVMANHVSDTYAKPLAPPDTLYQTDYRNEASNYWDNLLKISTTPGLPGGAINRTQPYAVSVNNWGTRIEAVIHAAQSAKLVVTTYYDSTQYLLKVKVKTTFLQAFSDHINLVVVITQDSLLGDQKDYNPPSTAVLINDDVTLNYMFNNMVIGSANGPQGQLVKSSPIVNDTATLVTPCFSVNRCFYKPNNFCRSKTDDRYVNVVAFLFNTNTQEVLQVEKIRIR